MAKPLPLSKVPNALARQLPAPYELRVSRKAERDLGFLADLVKDGKVIAQLEIYPYTVQKPGRAVKGEMRIQTETSRKAKELRRTPPSGRVGVMLGYRTLKDGQEATPLVVAPGFGTWGSSFTRDSIQFPGAMLDEAELFGASVWRKFSTRLGPRTGALIVAMRPEVFPFFATQIAPELAAPQDWDVATGLQFEEAMRRYYRLRDAYEAAVTTQEEEARRERVRREVEMPVRDRRFAVAVLRAYEYRCAVCGVQFELIEAARIDPVSNGTSTDDVNNGIALCALHHMAYDDGLLLIEPNGIVHVDDSRADVLAKKMRDGGLAEFKASLQSVATFPKKDTLRPHIRRFEARREYYRKIAQEN